MALVSGGPTALFHLYRAVTKLLAPFAYASVSRKLKRLGVPALRIHEKLGHASQPRPLGPLVWFHAASVGESLSVLTLIKRMGDRLPTTEFLITSGTATSAELIAKRMPARTRHQFAPLDSAGPVGRFFDHWKPDAGIFVESELWPQMLVQGRDAGTRLALLNARLSDKSAKKWQKFPDTARFILDQFAIMLTQNRKTADNLMAMGADPGRVKSGTNLKSTSEPLPIDDLALAKLQSQLLGRPVWVASSTHPGEEDIVLAAHKSLLKDHPDLCLILIPRHPDRGDAVEELIATMGLTRARRTADQPVTPKIQVYLADTLGETGTWYAASPLVFLGGSLLPIGGHNPFEPAQAGAAVLTGPHFANFAETFDPLIAAGGAVKVKDAKGISDCIAAWLDDETKRAAAQSAARNFAKDQQAALEGVIDTLCQALKLDQPHG